MGQNADQHDSLSDWKAKARTGEAPPADSVLRKQYVCDSVVKGDDARTYTFTISTGAVDRDHDTIAVDGWRLDNFLKAGGPVLWAHQSRDLPIGKAAWVKVQGGALKARVEFTPADVYPLGETVRRLIEWGALKSTSVGFLPDFAKAVWNEERGGFDFKGQELLEFSIVPVPSNPEALQDAKGAGIDVAPIKEWAERVLDGASGPGLWIPKAQAEAAIKALAEPRVVVPAFDPAPFVAAAQAAFQKAGRTLSAANESRIRTAADSAAAISAALDEVLAQVAAPEEPKAAPEPVLKLRADDARMPVTPDVVRAATIDALKGLVDAEVRRHTGRLD